MCIVPGESQSPSCPRQAVPDKRLFFPDLLYPGLGTPLKGRVRLWNESRHTDRNPCPASVELPANPEYLAHQANQAFQILFLLGRQADHEIKLQTLPTAAKNRMGHVNNLLVRKVLIYYPAQTVGSRLRGKSQGTFLSSL